MKISLITFLLLIFSLSGRAQIIDYYKYDFNTNNTMVNLDDGEFYANAIILIDRPQNRMNATVRVALTLASNEMREPLTVSFFGVLKQDLKDTQHFSLPQLVDIQDMRGMDPSLENYERVLKENGAVAALEISRISSKHGKDSAAPGTVMKLSWKNREGSYQAWTTAIPAKDLSKYHTATDVTFTPARTGSRMQKPFRPQVGRMESSVHHTRNGQPYRL